MIRILRYWFALDLGFAHRWVQSRSGCHNPSRQNFLWSTVLPHAVARWPGSRSAAFGRPAAGKATKSVDGVLCEPAGLDVSPVTNRSSLIQPNSPPNVDTHSRASFFFGDRVGLASTSEMTAPSALTQLMDLTFSLELMASTSELTPPPSNVETQWDSAFAVNVIDFLDTQCTHRA